MTQAASAVLGLDLLAAYSRLVASESITLGGAWVRAEQLASDHFLPRERGGRVIHTDVMIDAKIAVQGVEVAATVGGHEVRARHAPAE